MLRTNIFQEPRQSFCLTLIRRPDSSV